MPRRPGDAGVGIGSESGQCLVCGFAGQVAECLDDAQPLLDGCGRGDGGEQLMDAFGAG